MNKLNVCLLNDSFPPVIDGVANTVVNYANILQRENLANPFVVTPSFPNADDSQFEFPVVRYRSLNIGNLVEGYRAGLPFSGTLLMDVLNRRPDIIHTHCPVISTVIARELKNKTHAPIIFTYHTKFDIDIAKSVRSKHLQKDVAKALVRNISACDEVWVVSEGAGENLRSLGYQGDVVVMNNGVDFPKGRAGGQMVEHVSREYGLQSDVPVLLFVGRLLWYKGIRILIDALRMLRDTQDFQMVFVGKGADEEEIKEYVKETGMQDKIVFTGPIYDREKLRAMNTRGDLFLFPSTYDTNGLVVREAAACGLASLVISGSCAAEGITDGRNGFFCEEDAESMYKKLEEILKDLDSVHQVGMRAMEEIYISWSDSVHQAHERYQDVIERKRNGQLIRPEEKLSDDFYRISAEALLTLKRARMASIEEFMNIKSGITNVFDKAYDKVDRVYDRLGDKLHDLYGRLRRNIEETEQDVDVERIGNQDRYL